MVRISVSIDVSNMDKGVLFYTKALGCEELRRGPEISKLATENSDIYLLEKEQGSNPLLKGTAVRKFERHWTPVHLDFVVPNIESKLALIQEFGGLHEGSESGDWGSIAFCADPFGNGFCLVQSTG